MRVAVVIPFYKNKEQLDRCLAALQGQIGQEDIFVIDDSDTANGFTATVNHGLKMTFRYTYIIVLNQDCYLRPGAIDAMLSFMDTHPRTAISGIKQLSYANVDEIIHGGCAASYPGGEHYVGFVSKGDCDFRRQVPWVNGACMIVRVDAMREFGLMDPNYKMFYSDADWSYVARLHGWECWYIPEAVCVHEDGSSLGIPDFLKSVFQEDKQYFYDKWMSDALYKKISSEVGMLMEVVENN